MNKHVNAISNEVKLLEGELNEKIQAWRKEKEIPIIINVTKPVSPGIGMPEIQNIEIMALI